MKKPSFIVQDPGLSTTIQGTGRKRVARWGFPSAGAMDSRLINLANFLVGNPADHYVFECAIQGGIFEFHRSATIAITAIDAEIFVNNQPVSAFKTQKLSSGDILKIGRIRKGNFAYLAIQGEIAPVEKISFSAYEGDFYNFTIQKNQSFNLEEVENQPQSEYFIPRNLRPRISTGKHIIRVLPGPELDLLQLEKPSDLELMTFKLGQQISRMGFRAQTEKLTASNYNIPSSLTLPGTIQLTGEDSIIVLMRDAQVTGGYPRIGQIIEADLDRFAQLPPGTTFSLRLVDIEEALKQREIKRRIYSSIWNMGK